MAQDERIKSLEKCDCKKSCLVDGKRKEDNERWEDGCNTCICERGEIKCNPKSCIKPLCKNPEFPPDDKCCPRCLSELFFISFIFIIRFIIIIIIITVAVVVFIIIIIILIDSLKFSFPFGFCAVYKWLAFASSL